MTTRRRSSLYGQSTRMKPFLRLSWMLCGISLFKLLKPHPPCCLLEMLKSTRRVLKAGREIRLNHSEYSILYCMAKSPGRIYTREQLYAAVWGEEYQYGMTTVDNTIWRLRKKLESDPRHPIFIKTVFRFGYKLDA